MKEYLNTHLISVYIFRHGQTDWNLVKRCQGHTDIPLNSQGIIEAEGLSKHLHSIKLDLILCSDLCRARETAAKVNAIQNTKILYSKELRETFYGSYEGMFFDELSQKIPPDIFCRVRSLKKSNYDVKFHDMETRGESLKRFLNYFEQQISNTPARSIGISTHGGLIRTVIHNTCLPLNESLSYHQEVEQHLPIPNCVCYHLTYDINLKTFQFVERIY